MLGNFENSHFPHVAVVGRNTAVLTPYPSGGRDLVDPLKTTTGTQQHTNQSVFLNLFLNLTPTAL